MRHSELRDLYALIEIRSPLRLKQPELQKLLFPTPKFFDEYQDLPSARDIQTKLNKKVKSVKEVRRAMKRTPSNAELLKKQTNTQRSILDEDRIRFLQRTVTQTALTPKSLVPQLLIPKDKDEFSKFEVLSDEDYADLLRRSPILAVSKAIEGNF